MNSPVAQGNAFWAKLDTDFDLWLYIALSVRF
jgi:hypothetical protein